jgi:hypothetical protein
MTAVKVATVERTAAEKRNVASNKPAACNSIDHFEHAELLNTVEKALVQSAADFQIAAGRYYLVSHDYLLVQGAATRSSSRLKFFSSENFYNIHITD